MRDVFESFKRADRAWVAALLLSACAAPGPYVGPGAAGKPPSEVARVVAASEARLFPCKLYRLAGPAGPTLEVDGLRQEAMLAPGRYRVTLECASAYHTFKPLAELTVRPGRVYRLTGYLLDDSITIFTMKMGVKVDEVAP